MGWNGSNQAIGNFKDQSPKRGNKKSKNRFFGLLVVLIVITVCAVAVLYLLATRTSIETKVKGTKKSSGNIAEVAPHVATNIPKAEPEPIRPKALPPQQVGELRNGYRLLPNGRLHKVVGIYTSRVVRITLAERTFDDPSDQAIGELLTSEPGASLIGDSSMYYDNFAELFKKSLKQKIEIKPEDDDETKSLKQAVIDAREELKQHLDAGEDIVNLMRETRDQLRELGTYREELEKQVEEIATDSQKELTKQDVQELVDAANKMLEERGSKPMSIDGPMAYRLRVRKMRKDNRKKGHE